MASEIVMPQMGAEMEEGTVVRWTKQPGELIKRGEVIAEIETDKATVDLESFDEGYFLGPVVEDGTTVPVGTVIGYLGAQGEQLPLGAAPAAAAPQEEAAVETPAGVATPSPVAEGAALPDGAQAAPAAPTPAPAAATGGNGRAAEARTPVGAPPAMPEGRIRVSPVARSIAEELEIDLSQVRGSGPDGRIMRRDVEEFARARRQMPEQVQVERAAPEMARPAAAEPAAVPIPAPAPAQPAAPPAPAPRPARAPAAEEAIEPLSRMRQAIARRMAAAKREIPHYYVAMSVDMTEAMALRQQLNTTLGEDARLSVNDLIVKACALALEKYPRFNATYTDEGLRLHPAINIGIAVALDDGLIVPAVLSCQGKSLGAIAREAHDVTERARNGRLRPAELSDGTFTVSNLGMFGVETLIAIIQPDQAAILGVGRVEPRPVVRDGQVVVREVMTIALSADHRVTDGAQGAQFTAYIKELLEQPMRLVL